MFWWKHGLAVSLGLLVTQANAQDPGTGSQGSTPVASQNARVQMDRPIALNSSKPARRPGVQMGKAVAVETRADSPSTSIIDPRVRQTSFDNRGNGASVGNGDSPSLASNPSPGTPVNPAKSMFAWKQTGDEIAPPPRLDPNSASSSLSAPAPAPAPAPAHGAQPIPDPPAYHSVWTPEQEAAIPAYSPGTIFKTNAFYAKAEALAWRFKGDQVPTLGTTNGSDTVIGGNNLNNKTFGGARLTLGYWFDDAHLFGIEGSGFALGKKSQDQNFYTFGSQNLFTPVMTSSGPGLLPIAGPVNGTTGAMQLQTSTRLSGGELNMRTNWINGANGFVDLLAGYKTVDLNDTLSLTTINAGTMANGSLFQRTLGDQFQTKNQFYGGQIGSVAEYHLGNWVIDITGKIAMGTTRETVNLGGSTIYSSPSGTSGVPSGLFTNVNNLGQNNRNQFSVIPEAGVTLGYNFTDHLRGFCGYNFMYMSRVARPGPQINPNLSPSQAAALTGTSAVPATGLPFGFQSGDFWAQGITLGLEWRY